MDKLYNRTNWVDDNAPDIDAAHLNNIESGIDAIDNRVIDLNDGLSEQGLLSVFDGQLEQGSLNNGNNASSSTRVRTPNFYKVSVGDVISAKATVSGGCKYIVVYYNDSKVFVKDGDWIDSGKTEVSTVDGYVKFLFRKSDNTSVTPSSFSDIGIYVNNGFDKINNTLSDLEFLGWEVPSEFSIKNSFDGKVFTQRVGRVDLGEVDWTMYTPSGVVSTFFSYDIKKVVASDNIFSYSYSVSKGSDPYKLNDKEMTGRTNDALVFIKDVRFSNANDFKKGVKGIYLYYELATPITYNVGSEAVERVNESLSEQGLTNVFDGEWATGDKPNNTNANYCHTKNIIPVVGGDTITVVYKNGVKDAMGIGYRKTDGTYIVYWNSFVGFSEQTVTVPSDANGFFVAENFSGASATNFHDVIIYKNNEIEQVKADLTTQRVTLMSSPLTVIGNKSGNVIQLTFANGNINTQADTTILTIPEGWRPEYMVDFLDTYGKNRFTIGSDGKMVAKSAVNNNVRGSVVYLSI